MLDRFALRQLRPVLRFCAAGLHHAGVSADQVTLAGFACGLSGAAFIAFEQYAAGLLCILASRLADGVDGELARQTQPTDRGAFLDICLDFIFYASIPFAFALADPPRNALPASALLLAFIGTAASFLAYAVMAAKRGITSTAFPGKGLFYLGGLTEATETLVVFCMACIFPQWFPWLAWLFAALCIVTTCTRLAAGWHTFK
jgi:phosphatidylglycerophosphate synthase